MKRALKVVEPLPAKIEDCFAQFDKVFDSLAAQLDWDDAEPAPRAESVEPAARVEAPRPEPPAPQLALVQMKPLPPAPMAPVPDPGGDVLEQYERAFSELDDKLAESDGADASDKLRALAKTAPLALPAPPVERERTVSIHTVEEVFTLLDKIASVRRRARPSEDRPLIASLLDQARQLCADLDLQTARVRVEFAALTLESNHFELGRDLDELARHIRYDLKNCSIDSGKKAASR